MLDCNNTLRKLPLIMFNKLLKSYFKMTGNEHLCSFLDGLFHLGKPSQVFFPSELLSQGLGLVLSGLNNTMANQSNLNWVWPYWLERQTNPDNVEFIPTGVNLVTVNLTRRNWTSLGIPGSKRESMIDPVGMLTTSAFGPSFFPYLKFNDQIFLPPRIKSKQMLDGQFPKVITEYEVAEEIVWSSSAHVLNVDGEELVDFSHHLINKSDKKISLIFGIAVRPYNPLTIGHINHLKFKNNLWRINHRPGLLVGQNPQRVFISDRHGGDPLFSPRPQKNGLKSKSGILSGVCEYDLTLEPGEKKSIESFALIGKITDHPNSRFSKISVDNISVARSEFEIYFKENEKKGLMISIPDEELNKAFNILKNHIHVFDDGEHFTPGTFFYHSNWMRDSAFLSLAYENLSWQDRVRSKIFACMKSQKRSGFFRSQNGEWDSNGEALFTIINHLRHSGDVELANELYPELLKGAKWIEKMCQENKDDTTFGLLPAGISAEHFGPNDFYFWDNFWSIAGLKELLWLGDKLKKKTDWISHFTDEYVARLHEVMSLTAQKNSSHQLACSPSRLMDCAAIGNLVAISPLNLYDNHDYWVKPTIDYLWDKGIYDGLFFQKIIHTGLNPYLSIQLARALLAIFDERFFLIIDALLKKATPTLTWPEAIHPKTGGGCMGDGDHGWACAEFLSLLREMLIRETQNELHLAAGVPPSWKEFSVTNASTRFGFISYDILVDKISWKITRHFFQDKVPVYYFNSRKEKILLEGDEGFFVLK